MSNRIKRLWRLEWARRYWFPRWDRRRHCHGTIDPCQYVDWSNDNNPNAPWWCR